MNSTRYPQHPFSRGYFATYGDELKAARGKPSSRDFEAQALKCQQNADASMNAARYFDERLEEVEREAARLIGERPEPRELIEAVADEVRQPFERAKKWRLDAARFHQSRADELHRYAEQARAFEARFDPNPYVDRALDALEKHNAQVLAEQEKKRRKAQERRAARR